MSWIIALSAATVVLPVVAQAPDADRWSQLFAANNLDNEGNTPFHLKMTFQLYDFVGRPSETGTVEEWWASPESKRVVISAPSLNEGESQSGNSPAVRERYLVDQLLNLAVHPVPRREPKSGEEVDEETRKFGKASLNCLILKPSHAQSESVELPSYCREPNTDDLRFLSTFGGTETSARNSPGKFHDTFVALDLQISLLGLRAIDGEVTALQSFDPIKSAVELKSSPVASPDSANVAHLPGGVVAGKCIKRVPPEFPEAAKMTHRRGSVFLRATIGKDGTVQGLVPIASSDPVFDDAAVDAVRQWKYSPFLLNGEPTEVDMTITVNFAFN